MRKLIYILLFIVVPLSAQYTGTYNGKYGTYNGKLVTIQADNIPTSPENPSTPPEPTGDYTVFKQITFAELAPGKNSSARAQSFTGSDEISTNWDVDSTVIIDSDTVWQIILPKHPSYNYGAQWYGKMKLNGSNYNADTLTYARLSYYIKLSTGFYYSNGGKVLGLYADGVDNDGSGLFPAGWYSPGCEPLTPIYDPEWGGTFMGVFNGPQAGAADAFGMYLGYHNAYELSCANKNYDEAWIMDASGTTGDGTSTTKDMDELFPDDTWFKVTLGIKLNTVTTPGTGDANGQITYSVNDTCVGVLNGVILRNYESITIDYWGLKTFYGGGADPTRTSDYTIWYDDVTLWQDNDFTLPVYEEVETNVPLMPTPNTE